MSAKRSSDEEECPTCTAQSLVGAENSVMMADEARLYDSSCWPQG
jgi:hypothetical protein